jgi:glycosyltransferase involved in cell wall biosynthesis
MRVGLVACSLVPGAGTLERHVAELARGLTRRGVRVEVLAQASGRRLDALSELDNVVVRHFPAPTAMSPVSPGRWHYLRRPAALFDLVHVHGDHLPSLALAVARARPRGLVFTPHAPLQRLLRWPYARVTRVLVNRAVQTVCLSTVEADLLRRIFPRAASRVGVVPNGVNAPAIQAAPPFSDPGRVVLAVGVLERYKRVDRAIAAMASLDPSFRLVVVGDGPARRWLQGYARDLEVSARVEFVGQVSDAVLYRWLRTACVVVTLPEQEASGAQVLEALSAGTPVVASNIPVHHEAASQGAGAGVTFISPDGSPLEVVDGIEEAASTGVNSAGRTDLHPWEAAVDSILSLYERLIPQRRPAVAQVHPLTNEGLPNRDAGPWPCSTGVSPARHAG